MNIPLTVFFIIFVIGFLIKMPIGLSMIASSIAYFVLNTSRPATVDVVVAQFCSQIFTSFVMIAIPMFVFAANVMNKCQVTDRIFKWCGSVVGWSKGGLGHVNIFASLVFSGMTGAAQADAAGLGMMEIESMRRRGYDDGFSCALTAASSTIGPIFPPSIPMVMYATISGASVGELFMGGVVPGVLLALFLMVYVAIIARKRNYPSEKLKLGLIGWLKMTIVCLPSLITPAIILVSIYTGITSPTEAGALAGLWAILIGFLVYRTLSWKDLLDVVIDTARTSGIIALTLGAAYSFSFIIAYEKIPMLFSSFLTGFTTNALILLLVVNCMFLLLGMFCDTIVMIVVFVPIVVPLVSALGVDLVHFGVVIVLNMMIGMSTPPFGSLLFLTSGLSGVSIGSIIKEIIPMILVMIVVLLLITIFPPLVTFVPSLIG